MNILRVFSLGAKRILAKNCCVKGTVTGVGRSYLYVITKPARLYAHEGNTMFSHYIRFTYTVNGVSHKGKLWINLRYRCPQKGEQIDVYYDPKKPENYACHPFGLNIKPIGW